MKQSNENEGFTLKKFKDIPTPTINNIYSLNNQNSLNYFGNDSKFDKKFENNKHVIELKNQIEKERI